MARAFHTSGRPISGGSSTPFGSQGSPNEPIAEFSSATTGIFGILLMSAAAWVLPWYRGYLGKSSSKTKHIGVDAGVARREA